MKLKIAFMLEVPELGRAPSTVMDVPSCTNVGQLRERVASAFPSLAGWADFLLVSVEGNYVADGFVPGDGQEVLFALPRSGG